MKLCVLIARSAVHTTQLISLSVAVRNKSAVAEARVHNADLGKVFRAPLHLAISPNRHCGMIEENDAAQLNTPIWNFKYN
jgi:hypothetical protein